MTDKYPHSLIAIEGVLDVRRIPSVMPAGCNNNCQSPYAPMLVGIAATDTGASNIANIERYLELFNGKRVRVTIEYE